MKKILVLGSPGSGKSVFSKKLNKILNIPLYHLDNLFWNTDKTHVENIEFDNRLMEILRQNCWIIDGDYKRTYEIRMDFADTIFFLDYPLELCIEGAKSRVGIKRSDLPWIENEFEKDFEEWIINWHKDTKNVLLNLIEKYKNKNIIIFKSREEANNYLKSLV